MKQSVKVMTFFLCLMLIFGCLQKSVETKAEYASEEKMVMADAAPAAKMMSARSAGALANSSVPVQDKKIVYRANLTIETADLVGSREKILDLTEEIEGIMEYNDQNEQHFYFSLKIPADRFDDFLNEVKAIGRVTHSSVTAEDVTEQYYDTEARLESKRALLEKYRSYLPQASDLKEIMEVERQINSAVTELEQWEARMKRLEKEIAYSSVTVSLQLPAYVDKPDSSQTMKDKFLSIGKNLKVAFAYIGLGAIYFLAIGSPFFIAALLIFLIVRGAKRKRKSKKNG